MKTKGLGIGIIFLLLMVCTTCTKDEALLTPEGESSALKSAQVYNFEESYYLLNIIDPLKSCFETHRLPPAAKGLYTYRP